MLQRLQVLARARAGRRNLARQAGKIAHPRSRQVDPTQTGAIRKRFIREINFRFARFKRDLIESVVTNDCLGLDPKRFHVLGGPGSGNFDHAGRPGLVGGSGPGGIPHTDDQVYFKLIESGDMAAVQDMVDQTAQKLGLIPVWRGISDEAAAEGLWFAEDRGIAEAHGEVRRYYIRVDRPNVVEDNDKIYRDKLRGGHDAVVAEEYAGGKVYLLKSRNQVFPADPILYDREQKVIPLSVRFFTKLKTNAPARPGQFAFDRSEVKVEKFLAWLRDAIREQLLEVSSGERRLFAGSSRWSDLYITDSYKKGMQRAAMQAKKIGFGPAVFGTSIREIDAHFNLPFSLDRVGLIFTRTFEDLKGVTEAMASGISRVLAEGLGQGLSPLEMARKMNKVVDNIGINRARLIARTETIRAHHMASINTYREAGMEGVMVVAEWGTARDEKVCPICHARSVDKKGKPILYTLDEIEGLIPAHPNCRCTTIPIPVMPGKKQGELNLNQLRILGGPGSGNFGHAGRPGLVGGSAPSGEGGDWVSAPHPNLFDKQPTEILRWMGKAGWSFEQAQTTMRNLGVSVADGTIRVQMLGGRKGTRGEVPELTEDQKRILVDARDRQIVNPPAPKPESVIRPVVVEPIKPPVPVKIREPGDTGGFVPHAGDPTKNEWKASPSSQVIADRVKDHIESSKAELQRLVEQKTKDFEAASQASTKLDDARRAFMADLTRQGIFDFNARWDRANQDPKVKELAVLYDEASGRMRASSEAYYQAKTETANQVKKLIEEPEDQRAKVEGTYFVRDGTADPRAVANFRAQCEKGLAEFSKLISPEAWNSANRVTFVREKGRAGASGTKIRLDPHDPDYVLVHEMGHVMENTNEELKYAARTFLFSRYARAEGEAKDIGRLRDMRPGSNFDLDELAFRDSFPSEYCGKWYLYQGNKLDEVYGSNSGGGAAKTGPAKFRPPSYDHQIAATELISMGVQFMQQDPAEFFQKDPEYFGFILDVMKARIGKKGFREGQG